MFHTIRMEAPNGDRITLFPSDDRAQWKRIRDYLTGINSEREPRFGGSDVGTLMGTNPYTYRGTIFNKYIGRPTREVEYTENMALGHLQEASARAAFAHWDGEGWTDNFEKGLVQRDIDEAEFTVINEKYPFSFCNPDGVVLDEEGLWKEVIEYKSTGKLSVDEYLSGYAQHHYEQLQYNMAVMGLSAGWLVYLLDGRAMRFFRFEADLDLQRRMFLAVEEMANRVLLARQAQEALEGNELAQFLDDLEPEINGSEECKDLLKSRHLLRESLVEIEALTEDMPDLWAFEKADTDKKAATEVYALARNKAHELMLKRNAKKLTWPGGSLTISRTGSLYPKFNK